MLSWIQLDWGLLSQRLRSSTSNLRSLSSLSFTHLLYAPCPNLLSCIQPSSAPLPRHHVHVVSSVTLLPTPVIIFLASSHFSLLRSPPSLVYSLHFFLLSSLSLPRHFLSHSSSLNWPIALGLFLYLIRCFPWSNETPCMHSKRR